MDIEKLIERLKCPQIHSCPMDGEYSSCTACQKQITQEAAEALQYLSEGADEVNAALQEQIVENEKLRAELKRVRYDNRKLCSAMMMIRRSESPERMTVSYEMDYSAVIDHHTARDIALIVVEGLMQADHEQRNGRELC